MGLINRLIGNEQPKISAHAWPKAYDMYERDRITLARLLDGYDLNIDFAAIAAVFPGADKLALFTNHTWVDGDAVHLTTTDTLPGGLAIDTVYFVTASNPAEGTIKLSPQPDGTPIVDILDEGVGDHMIYKLDPDLIFWGQTRRSISSNAGVKDEELRKRVWDEMAEGIFELAESAVAFVDEQVAKEELTFSASYLDAS